MKIARQTEVYVVCSSYTNCACEGRTHVQEILDIAMKLEERISECMKQIEYQSKLIHNNNNKTDKQCEVIQSSSTVVTQTHIHRTRSGSKTVSTTDGNNSKNSEASAPTKHGAEEKFLSDIVKE